MNNGITFLEVITIRRFYRTRDNDFWPNSNELIPIKVEVFQNFKALYKKTCCQVSEMVSLELGAPK